MNIQNIKNETIAKLNRIEISDLGLVNYGVYTFRGTLKARKQGYKTEVVNDWQTNFVGKNHRIECIAIQQGKGYTDDHEYAFRIFDLEKNEYAEFWSVLYGCEFFR